LVKVLLFHFLISSLSPISTLFPYTTLFRSVFTLVSRLAKSYPGNLDETWLLQVIEPDMTWASTSAGASRLPFDSVNIVNGSYAEDRKSTRLNSSHVKISYAVFCLKKKK